MSVFATLRNISVIRRGMIGFLELVSKLNQVVPKDSNRILFYESNDDASPSDNSEAFCNWMVSKGLDERFSITYCASKLGLLASSNIKRTGRIRGVFEYLRSKYVFYSFGGMRIRPAVDQVVVNLWHGAPLKSIGKLAADKSYQLERLDDFTYIVSPSDGFADVFAKAFGCELKRVIVAGYPRCDYLGTACLDWQKFDLKLPDFCHKKILWMPTFRKSADGRFSSDYHQTDTGLPLLETHDALERANGVLVKEDCVLVIKTHSYAKVKVDEFSNIIWCDNGSIERAGYRLYEFVSQFDALLTDYSSIYFDWLALDRPVAFTIDDLQEYVEKRGFSVPDPLSLMPGEHIVDEEGLYGYFKSVSEGRDGFVLQRRRLAEQFVNNPGNNSRLLAEKLGIDVSRNANIDKVGK